MPRFGRERDISGYVGIPEAQQEVIRIFGEMADFNGQRNRATALAAAGGTRSGKTSVLRGVENYLIQKGWSENSSASLPYQRIDPDWDEPITGRVIFSPEIPVQQRRLLQKAAGKIRREKVVGLLDVVNKTHHNSDPRNAIEARESLEQILHDVTHDVRLLYPRGDLQSLTQLKDLTQGKEGLGKQVLIDVDKLEGSHPKSIENHLRHTAQALKSGTFFAGRTYLSEDGRAIITELHWTGKPTYGSIDGQSVMTFLTK